MYEIWGNISRINAENNKLIVKTTRLILRNILSKNFFGFAIAIKKKEVQFML